MIFDIGYPTNNLNNYSTESFNPVQAYAQYPRVRHPDENWKFNNRYETRQEAAVDPNMLDFGRLNINDPREQYDQQFIPAGRINRRNKCRGCALPFSYTTLTISSPDEINPMYCIGCESLFGSMSNLQVHQRLHHSTNMIKNNPVFEAHFLNDTSMHPHHSHAPPYDDRYTLFHLPCSPNYYRRLVNKYDDSKYVLSDVQPVIQDRVKHFYGCNGCRQFIEHERSPIFFDTFRTYGKYDMVTHREMLGFLSHNMTCMETGLQGCWSPTGKEFFSLQLKLRTPVSLGGRGFLNNFEVSLVGIDSLLETFDVQDVRRWLKAVKEHQGYYPPS
ncbi:hypothetical protein FB192DRAFT_1433317 [Mucor lusitanicus]|nr:hypothetical protein FB192DRAFT_1433317 [Mucor lusitanicus]